MGFWRVCATKGYMSEKDEKVDPRKMRMSGGGWTRAGTANWCETWMPRLLGRADPERASGKAED